MNRLFEQVWVVAALGVTLSMAFMAHAEMRTWTDSSGRSIQAEMVSRSEKEVVLRMGGRDYPLAMERLSKEDREFVQKQAAVAVAGSNASTAPTTPQQAPADSEPMIIGGVALKPGLKNEFTVPVDPELTAAAKAEARKQDLDKDVELKEALLGLAVPEGFDPAKSWPILIVSVTASGKAPSSVRAMGGFVKSCVANGWVCLAADLPEYKAPLLQSNRCALAKTALDALAAKWPASAAWPVATGGFSGGAKYSGWLGGYLSKNGRHVIGMFMGGCNEDMATLSLNEYKPKRAEFTKVRVFLSGGSNDKTASPAAHESVAKSLKDSGFDQVRVEIFEGEHKLNQEHVPVALKWFLEGAAS